MKIIVKNHSISESILKTNTIKWNNYTRNSKRVMLLFGTLCLVMLVMGSLSLSKQDMIQNGKCTIYYNINLLFSLGIAGLIVIGYTFYRFLRSQSLFKQNTLELANKFAHVSTVVYALNDECINIDRILLTEKYQWGLFSHKTVDNKFIFLHFSRGSAETVTIDARDFSDSEFKELMAFLHAKIR